MRPSTKQKRRAAGTAYVATAITLTPEEHAKFKRVAVARRVSASVLIGQLIDALPEPAE